MSWKRGKIVYCKDKSALKRLDEIRRKAAELLGFPFDPEIRILAVIQAETVEKIRAELTEVFVLTDEYLGVRI